jgi:hypothetical protein
MLESIQRFREERTSRKCQKISRAPGVESIVQRLEVHAFVAERD